MRNLLYGGAEEFLQDNFQEKALATTGSELKRRWLKKFLAGLMESSQSRDSIHVTRIGIVCVSWIS